MVLGILHRVDRRIGDEPARRLGQGDDPIQGGTGVVCLELELGVSNDPAVLGQPDVDRYRPASSFLLWGLLGGGEGGGHPASRDFPAI